MLNLLNAIKKLDFFKNKIEFYYTEKYSIKCGKKKLLCSSNSPVICYPAIGSLTMTNMMHKFLECLEDRAPSTSLFYHLIVNTLFSLKKENTVLFIST